MLGPGTSLVTGALFGTAATGSVRVPGCQRAAASPAPPERAVAPGLRVRADTMDGILLIYDAAIPPSDPREALESIRVKLVDVQARDDIVAAK